MVLKLLLVFHLIAVPALSQTISLEQYNIDPSQVTVSGISSGAAFATQYHVAYSSEVLGVAMFAGLVYHCANGALGTAFVCIDYPNLINVQSLIDTTNSLADQGLVDPVLNMEGSKVFIWQGSIDSVVKPGNGQNIEEFYQAFNADIATEFTLVAEHCQPTDYYGPACTNLGGEYINDCTYNGAYEALNYMYGNLTQVDGTFPILGTFSTFNQKEFFPLNDASSYSMDDTGFVYIPSGCLDKTQTCKLHIGFHGCLQGQELLGDSLAKNTGYLQVAERNNIVLLYPQIIKKTPDNIDGCWDWWGYNGEFNYATREGDQIKGIHSMIDRLINGN